MKKFLIIIIFFIISISYVNAFSLNIDEINIDSKSKDLINNLDAKYKINAKGFNKEIVIDKEAVKFSKNLINISFDNKRSLTDKRKEFLKFMYFSSDNGFDTLSAEIFIKMYLEKIENYKIDFGTIKDIKTVTFNDNDILAFVYIDDCIIDELKQDLVVSYWLKKSNNNYKIFYPWLTIDNDLENYFKSVSDKEDKGEYLGGSYNKISLALEEENVSLDELKKIYNSNKDSSIQITAMNDSGISTYGSGFFINEGIVVTTWSLFSSYLTDSDYIYVNDESGNVYEILGVVAAQADYDVVVLKLNKEVGKKVKFGDTLKVKAGDKIFTINSKNNNGFSISYGENININDGKLKNMFALNKSDVGSALYNIDGEVIGFNIAEQLNSDLSFGNSTDYLKELQRILDKENYEQISFTTLNKVKEDYYLETVEEKKYNVVSEKDWNYFKKIGNLEKNIVLPLVKASYVDNILSLRYKIDTLNILDSMYYVSNFIQSLEKSGYKLSYKDLQKTIYKNNKYKIIIKNNSNYLIVLIVEN